MTSHVPGSPATVETVVDDPEVVAVVEPVVATVVETVVEEPDTLRLLSVSLRPK
jgi:hypothetical protein